jgi:hypothetical protein
MAQAVSGGGEGVWKKNKEKTTIYREPVDSICGGPNTDPDTRIAIHDPRADAR